MNATELSTLFFYVYLFLRKRERETAGKGGAEREWGAQRIRSRLCADSSKPEAGLELTNRKLTT